MKRPSKLLSAVAALAAVGTLTLSAAQLASAQEPRTRHGFWGAFGLGYGSNSLSCSGGWTFNSRARGGGPPPAVKNRGAPETSGPPGGGGEGWGKGGGGGGEDGKGGWWGREER